MRALYKSWTVFIMKFQAFYSQQNISYIKYKIKSKAYTEVNSEAYMKAE